MMRSMKAIFRCKGLPGLLVAQSQVAFNDNATKLILIGLVQMLLPPGEAARWVSVIALLLVAPFVIFAPLTGWLADRFPKRDVLSASLWLQLGVMVLLAVALSAHWLTVAVGGFFLLGLQSALMAPARRGMVKDLAGPRVGEAIGWMEMLCIVAILVGSLAGGQMIDGLAAWLGGPWAGGFSAMLLLVATCVLSLVVFRSVPRHSAASAEPFRRSMLWGHGALVSSLRRDRGLWRAAWGDATFYLAGGFLMLTLSQVGRDLYPDGPGAARSAGIMMATLGGGVALGSVLAARLSRDRVAMGLVPLGALGMSLVLAVLALVPGGQAVFLLGLAGAGVFGGLYLVPLGAFLVDRAPEEERGKVLAASGMLSSVAGVVAVGLHVLAAQVCGVGTGGQFLLASGFLAAVGVAAMILQASAVLRLAGLALARLRYGVRTSGRVPATGGAVIVCNHVSYVDTIVLSLASPRPIRFVSYAPFFKTPVLGTILRIFGAIPVSADNAREAIRSAASHVAAGELVCIFPEGELTRTGTLHQLKGGYELIARRAKAPVVVAHLHGLWGSIFSYSGGRYFTKWPTGLRRHVTVSFSEPLAVDHAGCGSVREVLLGLGAAAFEGDLHGADLASELVVALCRSPLCECLVDVSHPASRVRRAVVLGLAWALSERWREGFPTRRIGVMLPPGMGGTLANVGLLLARRVPVNLNPLFDAATARECLNGAGIEAVLTARVVQRKFPDFPWPEKTVFIEDEIKALRGVWSFCAAAAVFPARLLKRIILPPSFPGREVVVLFTSGTSGLPKGVPLTSANILGNVRQVTETGFLESGDRVLSALPLFHSFGLTGGLFLPLLAGRPLTTAVSPLDADGVATAAREGRPTILITTPTFLRTYVRRIPRDAFGAMRLIMTGSERLSDELAAEATARFGCRVFEGYGLTEASPIVCVSMADPSTGRGAESVQRGSRPRSVGRLVPGMAMRLLDPETGLPLPGASRGILALRGANVIGRYLQGEGAEKFSGGWFVTGDVVSVDADGFLFVEGRTSRFSKIGGEMVSHAAVEQAVVSANPGIGPVCVLGRPSLQKGEELVLLLTQAMDRAALCAAMRGVPNLWLPRAVVTVDVLPSLPTGKVDIAACRRIIESEALA